MKSIVSHNIFILGLLFVASSVHSLELVGSAYGKKIELAKKNALASLSESLIVEVRSEFHSETYSQVGWASSFAHLQ